MCEVVLRLLYPSFTLWSEILLRRAPTSVLKARHQNNFDRQPLTATFVKRIDYFCSDCYFWLYCYYFDNRGSPPIFFAGMPPIVIFGSVNESMTTALAPTSIPSASSISPSIRAPAPIVTLSPIFGALSEYPCLLCDVCATMKGAICPNFCTTIYYYRTIMNYV